MLQWLYMVAIIYALFIFYSQSVCMQYNQLEHVIFFKWPNMLKKSYLNLSFFTLATLSPHYSSANVLNKINEMFPGLSSNIMKGDSRWVLVGSLLLLCVVTHPFCKHWVLFLSFYYDYFGKSMLIQSIWFFKVFLCNLPVVL